MRSQRSSLTWMPGPRSFTAEDVAELHLVGHPGPRGSRAAARPRLGGATLAEPGEFTRRAFENGRIDLTQAEGVAVVVSARRRRRAPRRARAAGGGLGERLGEIRDGLEAVRALAEASLDFDEADTGHVPTEDLARRTAAVLDALEEALRWERQRSLRRRDLVVCLAGRAERGKSTLFNRLAPAAERRRAAPRWSATWPGPPATRAGPVSTIEPGSELTVELVDTAGVIAWRRDPDRTDARAVHARAPSSRPLIWFSSWWTRAGPTSRRWSWCARWAGAGSLLVWNKTDLQERGADDAALLEAAAAGVTDGSAVSAGAGTGLGQPRAAARRRDESAAGGRRTRRGPGPARHVEALREAQAGVARPPRGSRWALRSTVVAQELREATDALDGISGRTHAGGPPEPDLRPLLPRQVSSDERPAVPRRGSAIHGSILRCILGRPPFGHRSGRLTRRSGACCTGSRHRPAATHIAAGSRLPRALEVPPLRS